MNLPKTDDNDRTLLWGFWRGVAPFPLFLNLPLFWQKMSVNFPDPLLSVYLKYFIIKINIQSRRDQTFAGEDGF